MPMKTLLPGGYGIASEIMADEPYAMLARDSIERGCKALDAGSSVAAARWFGRARRLAPDDPSACYLLAASLIQQDPVRALSLLDALLLMAPSHRDAHVSRIALLQHTGSAAEAAAALAAYLAKFPVPTDGFFSHLADDVCRTAGCAGWIGVTGDGGLAGDAEAASFLLDGRRIGHPGGLAASWQGTRTLEANCAGAPLLGSPIDLRSIAQYANETGVERPVRARPKRRLKTPTPEATWIAGRRPSAIVIITHASGGGVERHVLRRVREIQAAGLRALVLRPAPGDPPGCCVTDGPDDGGGGGENLFTANQDAALVALLRDEGACRAELHHWAAHAPAIACLPDRLGIPFDVTLHDYAALCPRVTLCGGAMRYCGEPSDSRDCDDCVADHGARVAFDGSVVALRRRSTALLSRAEKLVVPSQDAARRVQRYMPDLSPVVEPWEDDAALTASERSRPLPRRGRAHVAVVGAIGHDKGFLVLLACARDAERRDLDLHFTVVGHTIDDARLLRTGRAFVTGVFQEGEAVSLLQDDPADIGFIPSVWPETWCFALSALWEAGLSVAAFDLGAQAERIHATGAGHLLPLGLPAPRINDTLLRAAALSRGSFCGGGLLHVA